MAFDSKMLERWIDRTLPRPLSVAKVRRFWHGLVAPGADEEIRCYRIAIEHALDSLEGIICIGELGFTPEEVQTGATVEAAAGEKWSRRDEVLNITRSLRLVHSDLAGDLKRHNE